MRVGLGSFHYVVFAFKRPSSHLFLNILLILVPLFFLGFRATLRILTAFVVRKLEEGQKIYGKPAASTGLFSPYQPLSFVFWRIVLLKLILRAGIALEKSVIIHLKIDEES